MSDIQNAIAFIGAGSIGQAIERRVSANRPALLTVGDLLMGLDGTFITASDSTCGAEYRCLSVRDLSQK